MKFVNPLPGDENVEVCVIRQVERGLDQEKAEKVCRLMSKALKTNKMDPTTDLVLVPVRFTREGVHNGAFKPWDAIKAAADTLHGMPFWVNQPGEHEPGKWPPINDKTTWHGVVVEVKTNEDERALDGTVGLFKPEAMRVNGASEERIRFQETFLKALDEGGKFDVSVNYGAVHDFTPGVAGDKGYSSIEKTILFTGFSLVPRGAEPTAVMNADVNEEGSKSSSRNEDLNSEHGGRGGTSPMTLDPTALKTVSLSVLREASPEVNKLYSEHENVRAEANAAKERVTKLEADANAARRVLAAVINAKDPEAVLAKAKTTEELAQAVVNAALALAEENKGYKAREEKGLRDRITAAEKKLSKVYTAEKLALFKDGDLAATANRLETLVETIVPGETELPGAEIDAEANFDESADVKSLEDEAFEALLNARKESA